MNILKKRRKCLELFEEKFKNIKEEENFGKIMNNSVMTSMTAKSNYKKQVRDKIIYCSDIIILDAVLKDLENIDI